MLVGYGLSVGWGCASASACIVCFNILFSPAPQSFLLAQHAPCPVPLPLVLVPRPLQTPEQLELEELHAKHLFKARELPAFYKSPSNTKARPGGARSSPGSATSKGAGGEGDTAQVGRVLDSLECKARCWRGSAFA